MKLPEHRTSRLGRQTGDCLELLLRSSEEPIRRAEVEQDRAAARWADALEGVEDGRERSRIAFLTVERHCEPVGLVSDALKKLQPGIVTIEQDRL